MTDITDRDLRDALEWAKSDDDDPRLEEAAARVILSTVTAPVPNLAEALIRMANQAQEEGRFADEKDLSDLANDARLLQQDRERLSEELETARGPELKVGEAYVVIVDGRPCNAVVQSSGGHLGFALGGGWISADARGLTIKSQLTAKTSR